MADYLSISSLTRYLKLKFDRDPYLERVYVTGQVSNFRKRPTHQYFSLKDDKAVIQATMWAGTYKKLGFDLEEGMQVHAVGRVQLYEPGGSYSIILEQVEPDGIGALAMKYEQLRASLEKEGLFRQDLKQDLPRFVKKIGVITSPSGAVIQDIITTVRRRFAGVEIVLYPTKVQGDGAAKEVATNIYRANEREDLDVLIVGRGGGSMEDLWAFNEEEVVRAIFESHIPVISSVGHETDTTLADFVADRRAATPTAAAELATPVTKNDVLGYIKERQVRLAQSVSRKIGQERQALERIRQSVIFRQPERLYDSYVEKVDRLQAGMQQQIQLRLEQARQTQRLAQQRLYAAPILAQVGQYHERISQQERLLRSNMANIYDSHLARAEKAMDALVSLDTSRIIARGFALIQKEGALISSLDTLSVGDELRVMVKDGEFIAEVKEIEKGGNHAK